MLCCQCDVAMLLCTISVLDIHIAWLMSRWQHDRISLIIDIYPDSKIPLPLLMMFPGTTTSKYKKWKGTQQSVTIDYGTGHCLWTLVGL